MGIRTFITSILARHVENSGFSHQYEIDSKSKRYPARRFYREDLGIEFKSSMEANYARFMEYLGVKWEYESEVFHFPTKANLVYKTNNSKAFNQNPFGISGYVPDFKISAGRYIWYVEVKGYMDNISAEKIRLFHIFYPYLELNLVTPKEYRLIQKYYANKIRKWE